MHKDAKDALKRWIFFSVACRATGQIKGRVSIPHKYQVLLLLCRVLGSLCYWLV